MSMFADNPDFFPTPRQIARKMLARITNKEAKYFLEPSAGKGDIADVIRNPCTFEEFEEEHPEYADRNRTRGYDGYGWGNNRHSRVNIDVLESYPALIQVLRGKEYDVVGYDWLNYEGVSYYDAIVMNPPFSEGSKHLLKAWDFLHNGEIVCLLNEETIKNPHTEERKRLAQIIEQFGEVRRRQIFVIIVVDLHHRRVAAGAETLNLDPGELAVRRDVALVADLALADRLDVLRPGQHARRGAAELHVMPAHRLEVEHRVEGRDLERADKRHIEHLGDFLDGRTRQPIGVLRLRAPHQREDRRGLPALGIFGDLLFRPGLILRRERETLGLLFRETTNGHRLAPNSGAL